MNALFHRSDDEANAPVRALWFSDRPEISSPGGPFGVVTADNFRRPTGCLKKMDLDRRTLVGANNAALRPPVRSSASSPGPPICSACKGSQSRAGGSSMRDDRTGLVIPRAPDSIPVPLGTVDPLGYVVMRLDRSVPAYQRLVGPDPRCVSRRDRARRLGRPGPAGCLTLSATRPRRGSGSAGSARH